jgi:hypothetical protein
MNVADMMLEVYNCESLLLRVEKLMNHPNKKIGQDIYDAILKTYFHDANQKVSKFAVDALASFAEGDLLKTFLMGVKRFTKYPPVNVKQTRRLIAAELIKANEYCF